ncbi:MAG: phosphomannomutase/phosphoglucomutase [Acidobacteria bacterium]|nr:MAG: phosphomannomutase/phosphoglucomutase [Acidobacteriota bacterium]REJ99129.1 MAG: phosphomannomutase/phosphoglucomutase [Acidobacteriota bacterium]REK16150.1 MAG: phosphomannomutase/phosphoglucomutase [Acidobacteriota bacterium]REK43831.1 MAG: phosphomannomutase/phosphoglucomutase [Acidobacteriota bacterium]
MSLNPHIFREYDIRGIVGEDLTERSVADLALAIGHFFRSSDARTIAIGYDARESSPVFESVLADGLRESGIDVLSVGQVPTPVLYFAVNTLDVDGGIMITGSHNPPEYNGFKICLGKEALFGDQIREIGQIAKEGKRSDGSGSYEEAEIIDQYLDELASRTSLGSRKLKVVVDSGNGMGGVTAVPLYRRLGIDIIELFSDPDPAFPNHHPDPTVEENLVDLVKAVDDHEADAGIAFDGDGDRIGVIDENGSVIWGDELMILYARAVLQEHPGATIIGEVKCSQNLYNEIERVGGKPLMWKAGHSLIKAKMKETGSVLAGEMSGHIFFADRFYGFDDAAYAGARLLEILSKTDRTLSELLVDVPETFSTPEIRIPCPEDRKKEVVDSIAEIFSEAHEVDSTDGARIKFDNGWGLVRASNTQAILVLRFEAESEEALERISGEITEKVEALLS